MYLNDINVKRAVMVETARYDPMFLRPYTTRFDNNIATKLMDSTDGGNRITSGALAATASSFLQPETEAVMEANIDNGFSERRFSFMLELEYKAAGLSGGTRRLISGYTDRLGVSNLRGTKHLDPSMKLYFNSILTLRDTYIPGPHGIEMHTNVAACNHILYNTAANDYMSYNTPMFTLRPEDIMAHLEMENDPILQGFSKNNILDHRLQLNSVKLSNRAYESRPHYLSETITSFKAAKAKSDTYEENDGSNNSNNQYNIAREYLHTQPVSSDSFLRNLIGNMTYISHGYVTYQELNQMLPGLDSVTEVLLAGAVQQANAYQPGQGASWKGSSYETLAATILSQSVPAIMTSCLLTQVGFQATNDVIGGQHVVTMYNARGFAEGLDYSSQIAHFIERLKLEILHDISRSNEITYMIDVRIDVFNESFFSISLDGGPHFPYTTPSFCDGLYAPIVTSNQDAISTMSSDIDQMLNMITGSGYGMHSPGRGIGNSL